ncbi:hypothetical protein Tco_0694362 [Tanacetum coccineum]
MKIRDYDFNEDIRENAFIHIDKFLKIVRPVKINGLTQDQFRLSVFLVSLIGAASEWFTKECISSITTWDNMVERFILKFHHLSGHDEEEETEEDDNPNETDNVPEIFLTDRRKPNADGRRDYEACNFGDTQENQGHEEHKGNPNLEPSNCKIKRFKMMKYSFDDDEEYITIKESEYLNHSKDSLDAYRELLRLIDEGWVVTTPNDK